jgi:hypothetical protein
VIECVATERADVEYVAVPPVREAVPRTVTPSLKVTEPVGVAPGPVTVAVNVTDWPNVEGFALEASVAVDSAFPIVRVTGPKVLPVKLASPV